MKRFAFLVLAFFWGTLVYGQIPPNFNGKIPAHLDKKSIEKKVKSAFDKLPSDTTSYEGVKITYKKVPFQFDEMVAKMAKEAGVNLPKKMLKGMLKRYAPVIAKKISTYMTDIGTFENSVPLKIGSKKILPGKYKFGVLVKLRGKYKKLFIRRMVIWTTVKKKVGKKIKTKKVVYFLSFRKQKGKRKPLQTLTIKTLGRKKKPKEFSLVVGYGYVVSQTKYIKLK